MRVAILGYGKEGRAALKYYLAKDAEVTVFDENPAVSQDVPDDIKTETGKDCFGDVNGYDIVVRGPAIRPDRVVTDGRLTDATQLFFEECPAPIIGITGTKGKGTTSSLIFEILKSAGAGAHLAGNIGLPALDILPDVKPDDVVVLELSSFQLWQLKVSPKVAVVLMIEPDHMDVHSGMKEYVDAKSNITRWQKADDTLVYNPDNSFSTHIADISKAHKLRYGIAPAAHEVDGFFVIDEQKICSISDLLIPGQHNVENAFAAITAAWQYTKNTQAIASALASFKGLEHRLEKVRELHGVTYYNDSFSSAPGATIAAVNAFSEPEILICGGHDKHVEFDELANAIAKKPNVKKVLLIGQTKERIAKALENAGVNQYEIMQTINFADIILAAQSYAAPGDVVLLSPACASFGMFANFYDRGQKFKTTVQSLQ